MTLKMRAQGRKLAMQDAFDKAFTKPSSPTPRGKGRGGQGRL